VEWGRCKVRADTGDLTDVNVNENVNESVKNRVWAEPGRRTKTEVRAGPMQLNTKVNRSDDHDVHPTEFTLAHAAHAP
jgi:hypothetical protein